MQDQTGRLIIRTPPYAGACCQRRQKAVFKLARYDGGLATVSMQVGECKLSSLSDMTANRRPSSDMSAWKASMSLHGKQATYMKSKAIYKL